MERPRACVLQTDGINCDEETAYAWEKAGGVSSFVHVNDLLYGRERLKDYQAVLWSGGFSHGDYLKAGVVWGQEMVIGLRDQLKDFVENEKGVMLGICNGFQALTRCGLLPWGKVNTPETIHKINATLVSNDVNHFRSDWVDLRVEKDSPCKFLDEMPNYVKYMVAHGEGKFYARPEMLQQIESQGLVVFRYIDKVGSFAKAYPDNPNGSLNSIAGICDPTGRILGLMPHPERFVDVYQYDNWRRDKSIGEPHGLLLMRGIVKAASQI